MEVVQAVADAPIFPAKWLPMPKVAISVVLPESDRNQLESWVKAQFMCGPLPCGLLQNLWLEPGASFNIYAGAQRIVKGEPSQPAVLNGLNVSGLGASRPL
jgi:hypothetical protein